MKTLKISDELHRRLKVEAVQAGKSLQALIESKLVVARPEPVKAEPVEAKTKPVEGFRVKPDIKVAAYLRGSG